MPNAIRNDSTGTVELEQNKIAESESSNSRSSAAILSDEAFRPGASTAGKTMSDRKFVDTTLSMFPLLDTNGDNRLDKEELKNGLQLAQKDGTTFERKAIEVMVKNYNYLNKLEPSAGKGIEKETIWTADEILKGERKPWVKNSSVNDSVGTSLAWVTGVLGTVSTGLLSAAWVGETTMGLLGKGCLALGVSSLAAGAAYTTAVAASAVVGYGIGLGIDYAIDRSRDYNDYREWGKPIVDEFLTDVSRIEKADNTIESDATAHSGLSRQADESKLTPGEFFDRTSNLLERIGVGESGSVTKEQLETLGRTDVTAMASDTNRRALDLLVNNYDLIGRLKTEHPGQCASSKGSDIMEGFAVEPCVSRESLTALKDMAEGKTKPSGSAFNFSKGGIEYGAYMGAYGMSALAAPFIAVETMKLTTASVLLGASVGVAIIAYGGLVTATLLAGGAGVARNYYLYEKNGKKAVNHLFHEFKGTTTAN